MEQELITAVIDKLLEISVHQEYAYNELAKKIDGLDCGAEIVNIHDKPRFTTYNQIFSLIMDVQERIACNHAELSEKIDALSKRIDNIEL